MNNNMPNNFNNNGGQNPNNNIPNPMVDRANEQMAQGQSAVGQGPSIMQGQSSVGQGPNVMQGQMGVNTPGIIQGQSNAANTPGVMQGNPNVPKQEQQNIVPGQGNSGINAVTMQMEKPVGNEQAINKPAQAQPVQNTVNIPNVPNQTPNMINQNNFNNAGMKPTIPEVNDNQPMGPNNIKQEQNIRPFNQPVELNNQGLNENSVSQPQANTNINQTPNNNLNQNINMNPVNQEPNNNLNQNVNMNSVNQMPSINPANQTQNINPVNQPTGMNNMGPGNNNLGNNNIQNAPANNFGINNNSGIKPTPTPNNRMSAVGQTEVNHQSIPGDINIEEPKKKKFPLTTREMILVGIALVGVIAVIIIYI